MLTYSTFNQNIEHLIKMSDRKDLEWYIDLFGEDKRAQLEELYPIASAESFQNNVPELQDENADEWMHQALKWLRHVITESDDDTRVFEAIICSHMLCHHVEQYHYRPETIVSAFHGMVAHLLKCGIDLEGVERRGCTITGPFSYVWRKMNELVKDQVKLMQPCSVCGMECYKCKTIDGVDMPLCFHHMSGASTKSARSR